MGLNVMPYARAFGSSLLECAEVTGYMAWNVTIGVSERLHQVGVVDIMERSQYTIPSLAKTCKLADAIIKLAGVDVVLKGFKGTMSDLVDFDYFNAIWQAPKTFGSIRTSIEKEGVVSTLSSILMTCSGVLSAGLILQKTGVLPEFSSLNRLSERMGAFKVCGFEPFTYSIPAMLIHSPKNFLYLTAITLALCHFSYKVCRPEGTSEQEVKKNRRMLLTPNHLLTQVSLIGKVSLICLGTGSFCNTINFKMIGLFTQASAYIGMAINRPASA